MEPSGYSSTAEPLNLVLLKKLRNLEAAFAMFAAYYNYCWQTRKPGKSGRSSGHRCHDGRDWLGTFGVLTSYSRRS